MAPRERTMESDVGYAELIEKRQTLPGALLIGGIGEIDGKCLDRLRRRLAAWLAEPC